MDLLKPLVAVLINAGSVLQIGGLVALCVAAGLAWGPIGALTAAGSSSVLVGVAIERGG